MTARLKGELVRDMHCDRPFAVAHRDLPGFRAGLNPFLVAAEERRIEVSFLNQEFRSFQVPARSHTMKRRSFIYGTEYWREVADSQNKLPCRRLAVPARASSGFRLGSAM